MTAQALARIKGYTLNAAAPTHTCARCGRTLRNGDWLYSRHTGNRFCTEWKACDKRARRRSA